MAAKKTPASKGPASKTSPKSASKKRKTAAAPEKAAVKKPAAKKAVVKKSAAKKSAVKKVAAKKIAVAKTPAKKAAAKKTLTKTAVKKTALKKTAVKKATAKTPAKKTVLAKPVLKTVAPARVAAAAASKLVRITGAGVSAPRAKVSKGPAAAPAIRAPVRTLTSPHRPARSAARGIAPLAISAPPPAKAVKTRPPHDEPLSEEKLREDIRTVVLYLESWLRSRGAEITPAISKLAKPAESARAQVWRWLDREAHFANGQPITPELLEAVLNTELASLQKDIGVEGYDAGFFVTAAQLFLDLTLAPDFEDFPGPAAARLLD